MLYTSNISTIRIGKGALYHDETGHPYIDITHKQGKNSEHHKIEWANKTQFVGP